MKTVLVASDLSPRSDLAARRAGILAEEFGARLQLVHVLPAPDSARQEEAGERLRALAATVSRAAEAECAVRVGEPHTEIVAAAADRAAELIVMGAHDVRLSRIFVGTTVERVMRSGGAPVLMVNAEPSGPYRRILVAVDMSDASAAAIRAAHRLGLLAGPDVFVMHAFEVPAKPTLHYAGAEPGDIERHVETATHDAARELTSFLAATDLARLDYDVILEEGPPYLSIEKTAGRIRPDLVVIGTQGRSGLQRAVVGSVAEEVLRRMACDVLAVPPAAEPG